MTARRLPARIGSVITILVLTAVGVQTQDGDLTAARDLYASAAYDDALSVLNRLRASGPLANQSRAIEQYRAFCLLALGRAADAEQAIEAAVVAEPSYRPSDSDMSPRVRTAFTTVRRRMLPAIIQQQYAEAKAAFDRKDFAAAADGFSQVLATLADEDVESEAAKPPLSDLRVLAVGFEELSAKSAAPPPPSPPAPVVAPSPEPALSRIYTNDDPNVAAPAIVNQSLPRFPGVAAAPFTGRLEVVINEAGTVESAVIAGSVTPAYDTLALNATRSWRFKPATLNGTPVKFRKVVVITIKPTT
jgi:TonB family protein